MPNTRQPLSGQQERWVRWMLGLTAFFNVVDYGATLFFLSRGFQEGNPFIRHLLDTPFFPLIKLGIIPLLLWFLWTTRRRLGRRLLLYTGSVFLPYLLLMLHIGVSFALLFPV